MTDPDDRFGMPESAFKAARESHGLDSPVFRAGMYVPTAMRWPHCRPPSFHRS